MRRQTAKPWRWEFDSGGLHRHSQLDRVVGRIHQILLGAEVPFGRLHRCMAEQELDLFKLSTRGPAQLRARPTAMPNAA